MTASLAEIEIMGGIAGLRCPITGIDVIAPEKGFDSEAEHSPHLRFSLIAKCAEALPKSALILEILNPPAPSFDGEVCYACFDLSAPASKSRIRLQEAG